jgi:lipooligosaccharide transport system ATP-binding protein
MMNKTDTAKLIMIGTHMLKNIITVKNVNKTYKKNQTSKLFKAVNDVSFNVEEASCFGFLGPNGAGKTTMMKMIYCRIERDINTDSDSKIDIFGIDPARDPLKIKFELGVVPQEDNLDEELNVFQNLMIYSKFFGLPKKEAKMRIDELLEFMELSEKRKSSIRALSGGMKRRLVIARALLHNPRLLILDEPTTGLDPQVRHTIWEKLQELKENGTTILLTTHYMDEAFQICDNIIIMDKGKKILEGSPKILLKENLEKYVLELKKSKKNNLAKLNINEKTIRIDNTHSLPCLFSNDFNELRKITEILNDEEHYLRQTNLEDLFMKLTGRSLNEHQ